MTDMEPTRAARSHVGTDPVSVRILMIIRPIYCMTYLSLSDAVTRSLPTYDLIGSRGSLREWPLTATYGPAELSQKVILNSRDRTKKTSIRRSEFALSDRSSKKIV